MKYLEVRPNVISERDNARPQKTHRSIQFLKDFGIARLDWPPRSPYISSVKYVEDFIGRTI